MNKQRLACIGETFTAATILLLILTGLGALPEIYSLAALASSFISAISFTVGATQ